MCVSDAPSHSIVFIYSAVFTRQVKGLLTDGAYAEFQQCLAAHPQLGDVIQGTGGLRKVHWSIKGGYKIGGVRVIYFHVVAQAQVRLLLIYRKGVKDELTAAEKKVLRKLNADW